MCSSDLWSLFWLFLGCSLGGCIVDSTNPVVLCDSWSKVVAERFACGDDCETALNRSLGELAPPDYDSSRLVESLRPPSLRCVVSPFRYSSRSACFQFFAASMSAIRSLPVSLDQAHRGLRQLSSVMEDLDLSCGAAWRKANCVENRCPPRNMTCRLEEQVLLPILRFQKILVFYSLRRERDHLEYIIAACQITGDAECLTFVGGKKRFWLVLIFSGADQVE